MVPRQLLLEFVETPKGGNGTESSELDIKEGLRLKSKARTTKRTIAAADRTTYLLEEVASEANLASALLHVAKNKGAAGIDGKSVDEVLAEAETLLPRLSRDLLEGRYRPTNIRRLQIPKPGGGERNLGIPTVLDRWVGQAILQTLTPLYEPNFHQSSHGFRPERGATTAITEAKTLVNAGKDWVVSVDLSKFFDRVNHQRLMSRLAQTIRDKRLLKLIHQMIKAKVVLPDGLIETVEEGTPQGGPLSPLLSNIVLDELDWELERRNLSFVRYADDLNVFVRCKRAGARVMASLTRFIVRRLRLQVNEDKTVVDRPENVHILGFSLKRNQQRKATEVLLSARSIARVRAKVKELTPRSWGQSLDSLFDKLNEYLRGWIVYFSLCTEAGALYLKKIDAHIRRRIRCLILGRFRRKRFLFRHLKQRGASEEASAKLAYNSKGLWVKSIQSAAHRAYPNKWFQGRLLATWTEWAHQNLPPIQAVTGQYLLDF